MKKFNYIIQFVILLVGLVSAQAVFADVKIKTRQTMSGQSFENATYIKGKRERAEQNTGGMQSINITQCDLKRSIQIMPQAQTYLITDWADDNLTKTTTPGQTTKATITKGGVVTMIYTTKDTGERKQMFGYTARHLIITMETNSSADACSTEKTKMEYDGWYIDATFALDCETDRYKSQAQGYNKGGCQDRYETKQVGTAKRGYPVYEKMTMFDQSGNPSYTIVNEVLEISSATLADSLFDVPAGYRQAKSSAELYTAMSGAYQPGDMPGQDDSNGKSAETDSAINQNVKNMANETPAAPTEVGAKKEGVIRIGLANVKTNAVADNMNSAELATAIQKGLANSLQDPKLEIIQLEGTLPAEAEAEARQKECDFVIYAAVTHKKGGGGGFGFAKAFGTVVAQTGIGHTGSVIGNIAGQVATQAIVASTGVYSNVKLKDELTLDIQAKSQDGSAALAKQFKAKAKNEGEDIVTPVIEQAAQAIHDVVAK